MLSRCSGLLRKTLVMRTSTAILRSFSAEASNSGEKPLRGVVKTFDSRRGFGFLEVGNGVGDIFVHQSQVHRAGFRFLTKGEEVLFTLDETERGRRALNVTGLDGEALPGHTWKQRPSYGSNSSSGSNQSRSPRRPRQNEGGDNNRRDMTPSPASEASSSAPTPSA